MIQILTLLLAGLMLLLSQCGTREHLYTEKQVLQQLEETYGEEFTILRRAELNNDSQGNRYVRQGIIYTVAPLENTDLTFEVQDLVGTGLGSPVPQIINDEFHILNVYYIDTVMAQELDALCREEEIRLLDNKWYRMELSEENWEEQAEALADFFDSCTGRRPYDCGRPMNSWLSLQVGSEDGNRWGGGFYYSDDGHYGLDLEAIIQELGGDPEALPEVPEKIPEEPALEVHYGDKIILDGDEVIVVNNYEEPEDTTVPFEGTIEGEEWSLGTVELE